MPMKLIALILSPISVALVTLAGVRLESGGAANIDLVTLAYLTLAIVLILFAFEIVSEVGIPHVVQLKLRQVESRVDRLESDSVVTAGHAEEARLQATEAKDVALSVGAIPMGRKSSVQTVLPRQIVVAQINTLDPQKGQWGGKPRVGDYQLSGVITPDTSSRYFGFD